MVYKSDVEIKRLQRLRIEMENRLTSIETEQKTLEKETKIIREKAAIQELQALVRKKRAELARERRIRRAELEEKPK